MSPPTSHNHPWAERFASLIEEAFNLLGEAAEYHQNQVSVIAQPQLFDRNRRAVYRLRVRGELVQFRWSDRLSTILFRARSILDVLMYHAVESDSTAPLSERQKRQIYFPIVLDELKWQNIRSKFHIRALSDAHKEGLRSIQPFVTGSTGPQILGTFHTNDKHRSPEQVHASIDEEFVMLFNGVQFGKRGRGEYWIDWANPLPDLVSGAELVTFRTSHPITKAKAEKVPIALSVTMLNRRFDLQHLLWDVLSFVARAEAALTDGDSTFADLLSAYFDAEHAQLNAFKKMMTTGDDSDWSALVNNATALPSSNDATG